MIKRILESLEERRTQLKDEDKGFTLIELLVVVLIIGVLVAIAIPIYIGLQDGAKDAQAKSDLTNAKIALVGYYSDGNTAVPALNGSGLASYGWVDSFTAAGPTIAANPTSANFCIEATSESTGTPQFHINEDGVVVPLGC